MSSYSECLEALQEWEASEQWVRNSALRYPNQRLFWYLWCRRTGHGDLEAAKRTALLFVEEHSARNPPDRQDWIGIFHLLNGERKRAYEAFQTEHSQTRSYWSGFHVVLLADEFGEPIVRDRVMSFLTKSGVPDRTASTYSLAKFAVLLHDAYHDDKGALDLAALDVILDAATENERMDFAYFAAKYLLLRGRREDAERYLKQCYATNEITQLNRTLAGAELLDAGLNPNEGNKSDE